MVVRLTRELVESPGAPMKINMDAVWPVLRHVLATNIGFYLYMHWDGVRCSLLEAPETAEFITADQPLLNLAAEWSPSETPPDELDLLYPISPQYALRIEVSHSHPGLRQEAATVLEANWWNQRLFSQRGSQAFAKDPELLTTLAKGDAC